MKKIIMGLTLLSSISSFASMNYTCALSEADLLANKTAYLLNIDDLGVDHIADPVTYDHLCACDKDMYVETKTAQGKEYYVMKGCNYELYCALDFDYM